MSSHMFPDIFRFEAMVATVFTFEDSVRKPLDSLVTADLAVLLLEPLLPLWLLPFLTARLRRFLGAIQAVFGSIRTVLGSIKTVFGSSDPVRFLYG